MMTSGKDHRLMGTIFRDYRAVTRLHIGFAIIIFLPGKPGSTGSDRFGMLEIEKCCVIAINGPLAADGNIVGIMGI